MEKEAVKQPAMEVEYLREMRQNYLMIEAEKSWEQGYAARMMVGNMIEGLLQFRIKKTDHHCKFCYEITSKQPLSRLLETKTIGAVQIRKLLLGIAGTLSRMEEYLLAEEQILLDPEYIYVDTEGYEPFLCLVPGKKGNFPEEFSLFLHYLLGKTDHQDQAAVVLIYGLYRESLKENYGLDNLMRRLLKEDCPDVDSIGKRERYETINKTEIESWKAEESEPSWEETKPLQGKESFSTSFAMFGGAGILFLLTAGTILFMGIQGFFRYGIWLAAVGAGLAAAGIILWVSRFFLHGKNLQEYRSPGLKPSEREAFYRSSYDQTSGNIPSYSQLSYNQTAHGRTSGTLSKHSPLIGNPISQSIQNQREVLKSSAQTGQWQMIFEEEHPEEMTEEVPDAFDSDGREMQTVLLWNQDEGKTERSLVSEDGGTDILLSYYPFIIGKQEGLCDYVLSKNTVSRLHVRIDEGEDGYQVTDLNSTNGTFVKGRCLAANETVMVQPGDEIRIADLRFRLK